ncbi:glycosyltransferase [Bacteroides sp.]|uniref:glycosyltransferase n=1 Tax=Bacteroides sp. TaxID=29523 RepID=UPI0026165433|nr:glycosyltransferase [Bacteroides sp.]MDD3036340.1 glycosyltransferase [Bacteroides sp.]
MDVDIVIPIYNAFDFVNKCIETVIEHTDLTRHTLLLINDKSTDERILPLLNSFIENNQALNIKLIDNKENQGFIGTVNIGMQNSLHDVVLLNSDTEVTKNWLLKIQNCAYSKPAVATVTPLSNNATLASVPEFLSENRLPSSMTVDEYAEIVEKCSMNLFPEIPTAHGFCMYIKREAIDNLGLFDEKTFGKGYGEENDFSYRCLQAGYRHLLCDNTYIYHKGTQSFSQEKTELINSHLQILKERYPSCFANTELFIQQNPISEIQLNIRYGIDLYSKKNVLIIIHEFKAIKEKNIGGTILHVYDLIKNMRKEFNFHIVYYSIDDFRYYLTSYLSSDQITTPLGSYFSYTTLKLYNDEFKKEIERLTDALRIDLIHIHHLRDMYLDIFKIAEEKKIPVIYTLHDFYSMCPSVKLFDEKTFLCNYSDPEGCNSCLSKKFKQNVNIIPLWRKEFYKNLKIVKKIIVPSFSTKKIFLDVYKDLVIDVVEHGYDRIDNAQSGPYRNKRNCKNFNIAFIGGISEEKGLRYLKELISEAKGSDVTIHLFGITESKKHNTNTRNYIYHGEYLQKDLPNLLFENNIKLICLMSMWPETYSYTLTESLISELPVITFDLGAIAERVKAIDAGWVLPINSTTKDVFKLILTIKSTLSGEEYRRKVENIRHYSEEMKSVKEMTDEYTEIYNRIISRFPVLNQDADCIQAKVEFYQKNKILPSLNIKLMEEKKEYKRVKDIIKSSAPFKYALKEAQDYYKTHTNKKWRNKIIFKFIWYRILCLHI